MWSGKFTLSALYLLWNVLSIQAQNVPRVILIPESTLKITGLTNVNSFSLTYFANNNTIHVIPDVTVPGLKKSRDYQVDMILPIRSFVADNPGIKQDFLDLVQVKRFPTMHIYIPHMCINSSSHSCKDSITNVEITIGGITKTYAISFHSYSDDKELVTSGHRTVNIRDFQLEPPRKFFGLVQVKETIDIDFTLLLLMTAKKSS
jgi:hypothetical protein